MTTLQIFDLLFWVIPFLWISGSIAVGISSIGKKDSNFITGFFVAFFCSPIIAAILMAAEKDKQTDEVEKALLEYLKSKK